MFPRIRSLALGGAALWIIAGPAAAVEATDVADALVAAMKASENTDVAYESAEASGDNVTISGLTAKNPDGGTITVPSMLITGAEMRTGGGFTADEIAADGVSVVDPSTTVTWETAKMTDVTVPSADEIAAEARMSPFGELDITGIKIEEVGGPGAITIAEVDTKLQVDDDGVPRDVDLTLSSLFIPAAVLQSEPEMGVMLKQLGYEDLTMNIAMSGSYETNGDKLDLRNFTLDLVDVGKLEVMAKISGISMTQFADQGPDAIGPESILESLSIRFDNAGIVEKGLDMQAEQMGVSRGDMVAQLTGALPLMLNTLQNPAFQEEVASAATTFLNDPKSIAVTATPANPVSFQEIMGAAMMNPGQISDLLSLKIMANQ